jgi:hypothetical protein
LLVVEKWGLIVGGVDAYFFCLADVDFQADFSGLVL